MKKLMIIALLGLLISCKGEKKEETHPDYVVIYGSINNPIAKRNLRLYDFENQKSSFVEVDKDGNFRDTLKLDHPTYYNAFYQRAFPLYLNNGMDLKIVFEDSTAAPKFDGNGEKANQFLHKKSKLTSDLMSDYKAFLGQSQADYDQDMKNYKSELNDLLKEYRKELDSSFVNKQQKDIESSKAKIDPMYKRQQKMNEELAKGTPSPEFKDYKNYEGGTMSLADLNGKYTYIDVWATWCAPCKYEIPFLKKVEKEYEGKNIQFVSLSIDRPQDEGKWRDMIKDKELTGIQLLADNAINSEFIQDYYIQGIPRFIILDPKGNIVDYDAARPSEDKLKDVFNSLDL